MSRHIQWVGRQQFEPFPGSSVETEGNPGSAVDLSVVRALAPIRQDNFCYTDAATCEALARIVQGEVQSASDLESAELALRVLLFHDRVDVLVPGFKWYAKATSSYRRSSDPRSNLAYELFSQLHAWDEIYSIETFGFENARVATTSLPDPTIVGTPVLALPSTYLDRRPILGALISKIPAEVGAPAYLSSPYLVSHLGNRGFGGIFYDSMRTQWDEATNAIPQVDLRLSMPPLVAILLDRCNQREDIPGKVLELQEELAPVRRELSEFNEVLSTARDQKTIESKYRFVKDSFDASFKASRFKSSIIFQLLTMYKAMRSPVDIAMTAFNPNWQPKDPRLLASRTVTARTFAKLTDTDSIHSLLTGILTQAEIANIERSGRENGN